MVNRAAPRPTLILTRSDIERTLDVSDCIEAIERAFRSRARGEMAHASALELSAPGATFHVKAALLREDVPFFVAKTNANVPGNPAARALPTIQGVLALFDAETGEPLALMDSASLTALRTAGATAVAARRLARRDAGTVTLVGCGAQAMPHLIALRLVRPIARVYVLDRDDSKARDFARRAGDALALDIHPTQDLGAAARTSAIVVTCTPSTAPFLTPEHLASGTFVAAVGADNPHKQELDPAVLATSAVVVDDLEQCATMGELHHALVAGAMTRADVRADLAALVADPAAGRRSAEEIIVFDSTGVALEDVAAAAVAYRRALAHHDGLRIALAE